MHPKKIGTVSAWLLAFVALLFFFRVSVHEEDQRVVSYHSSSTPSEPSSSSAISIHQESPPEHIPDTAVADSAAVIDGDTVILASTDDIGEHVRIIGIDAPERGTCFAQEATTRLQELVQGSPVLLTTGTLDDRDVYGRLLRYVETGGEDIGGLLIAEGYAKSFRKFPHPKMELYLALEKEAKDARRGLWGFCKK